MANAAGDPTTKFTESNEILKLKFRKLHLTVVNSVNPASIINFLFQEDVIGANSMRALLKFRDDPQQQCNELLALLHTSENPEAFAQLYLAIRMESDLKWLVDRIDKLTHQSLVGQVVHALPDGGPVLGLTLLAGELYVLKPKASGRDQVEVYNAATYRLQRCLTVPDSRGFHDMTSCEHFNCIYIVDPFIECIYRLEPYGADTQWAVNHKPFGLSVNVERNVLVTCREVGTIKEFTTHGDVVREVLLPDEVVNPWHAVQSRNGQFIVCHGDLVDAVHRVCVVSADGRRVVHSHGALRGSDTDQHDWPDHVAVDTDESVFVADFYSRRVTLLSPTLDYVREVVSSAELNWFPRRLCLDAQRRRLYVADNAWKNFLYTAGRVIVFSV